MEGLKIYFSGSCNLHILHFWYAQANTTFYTEWYYQIFLTLENCAQMGQSLEAFLQWKAMVSLLLSCIEAVSNHMPNCSLFLRNCFEIQFALISLILCKLKHALWKIFSGLRFVTSFLVWCFFHFYCIAKSTNSVLSWIVLKRSIFQHFNWSVHA